MKMKNQFYNEDTRDALSSQRLAQEIAFAPVVFQVSRTLIRTGILERLLQSEDGMRFEDIADQAGLSPYATQCLLESALSIGLCFCRDERFHITRAGVFLLNDTMARVNLDFIHDVCYQGLFHLETALRTETPAGLKTFGDWPTIYEALSQLPEPVRRSWFAFDHYYSDGAFAAARQAIFAAPVQRLLDVGGNTGRFAASCVAENDAVQVTIMDLAGQLATMRENTANLPGAERILGHATDLLNPDAPFPAGFDVIWMSQFLDCFSEAQVVSILRRAQAAMSAETRLFILEPMWDRQRFETAAYCLNQISLYFTALANGNSKMFHSGDLQRLVDDAGLRVTRIHDGLGLGHSLLECRLP